MKKIMAKLGFIFEILISLLLIYLAAGLIYLWFGLDTIWQKLFLAIPIFFLVYMFASEPLQWLMKLIGPKDESKDCL